MWRLFSDLDLTRSKADPIQEPARVLHARTEGGCAAGRRRSGSARRAPATAIVGACGHGQRRAGCCRPKAFRTAARPAGRRRSWSRDYRGGCYVTLRLTSSMYHRFHAPYDCRVEQVTYISGDTWNVNPIALERIERLFCKNERAVIRCRLRRRAACSLWCRSRRSWSRASGCSSWTCCCICDIGDPTSSPATPACRKGEEMGWFQHGSTIIVLAPPGVSPCRAVVVEGGAHPDGGGARGRDRRGKGGGRSSLKGRRCRVSVAAIEASTAMRTATPLLTCSRITERGPSATSDEISTPRFIGPGCITRTLGDASFRRCASRP